mmetsp:Transcript_3208/g.4566  ORF Transcript_3208/g.4566 Transcript_3208/m.4566 type:complete len:456 (-) Transcript_3208:71-1438(-)
MSWSIARPFFLPSPRCTIFFYRSTDWNKLHGSFRVYREFDNSVTDVSTFLGRLRWEKKKLAVATRSKRLNVDYVCPEADQRNTAYMAPEILRFRGTLECISEDDPRVPKNFIASLAAAWLFDSDNKADAEKFQRRVREGKTPKTRHKRTEKKPENKNKKGPTDQQTSATRDFVFDFDCTLSEKHLYHVIHTRGRYLQNLLHAHENGQNGTADWDRRSKSILSKLKADEAKLEKGAFTKDDVKRTQKFKYVGRFLGEAEDFVTSIFGGKDRLNHLRHFLKSLHEAGIRLHVSTKGIVSEVVAVLRAANLIGYFCDIEGHGNDYMNWDKTVYRVHHGYRGIGTDIDGTAGSANVFFGGWDDLQFQGKPLTFSRKPDFILSKLGEGKVSHAVPAQEVAGIVFYADDDQEYYPKLRKHRQIECLDVGRKEEYYKTGKPGLGRDRMETILKRLEVPSDFF